MCRSVYVLIKLELRLICRSITKVLSWYQTVEMEAEVKIIFMNCKTKVLKRGESWVAFKRTRAYLLHAIGRVEHPRGDWRKTLRAEDDSYLTDVFPLSISMKAWPAGVLRSHGGKISQCLDYRTMQNVGAALMRKNHLTEMEAQTDVWWFLNCLQIATWLIPGNVWAWIMWTLCTNSVSLFQPIRGYAKPT